MIPLDSESWTKLRDANGPATGIPALLAQLRGFPADDANAEPWHSLWSALAHQGEVHPASFAAVPHVIDALAADPARATPSYFRLPARIEICRQKSDAQVPVELAGDYFAALQRIPTLVGSAAKREWNNELLQCALASMAAAQGRGPLAASILELSPEVAPQFLDWFYEQ